MSEALKKRIILPKNPDTYYGCTSTIENLLPNTKLYIGFGNRVEVMFVEEIRHDKNLNSYEIHTDKAILLAGPLTRIAYSTVSE